MNDVMKWLGEQIDIILGVAGLVTGFIFWWVSRRPKSFGWQIMSQAPILSRGSSHLPLKVVYDGKDVSSPHISVVRLGNTGRAELQSGDFDGPVRISFPNSSILQMFISGRSSDEINPTISTESASSISFTPSLLNPGEWLDLQFVTDGSGEAPEIRSRVAGQKPGAPDSVAGRKRLLNRIGWWSLGIGAVFPIVLAFFIRDTSWLPILTPVIVVMVFGGMFIANLGDASVWQQPRKAKKRRRKRQRKCSRSSNSRLDHSAENRIGATSGGHCIPQFFDSVAPQVVS